MTPPDLTPVASSRTGARPWQPQFDLKSDGREVAVFVDLPGIDEDQLAIEIQPNELVIEGERPFDHDDEDAEEFLQLGRPYGSFVLRIDLPDPVDPNQATAKYRRGVLRLRLPIADRPFRGRRVHP